MKLARLESLKRPALIVAALALAAGMVAGRERPAVELVEPAARSARVQAEEIDTSVLERPQAQAPQRDPFARKSFAGMQMRAAATARSAPVAPPLPYRYIGKLIEDGRLEVILLRGAEQFTVAAAGPLDAEYRVDEVNEKRIAFTYLPLNASHILEIE
jgi:hypothetical protein